MQYCPTNDMIADMGTKLLAQAQLGHLIGLAHMG